MVRLHKQEENYTVKKKKKKKNQWHPKSADNNSPDYYFLDKVRTKVYKDKLNTPFENEEELI